MLRQRKGRCQQNEDADHAHEDAHAYAPRKYDKELPQQIGAFWLGADSTRTAGMNKPLYEAEMNGRLDSNKKVL
ncbi:hypothetical protein GCM10011297_29910 [Bacterioplanes sanyensis]|nr:hypothetical protein GCM10011297_29910 [Bacterioplanes sanyensis]